MKIPAWLLLSVAVAGSLQAQQGARPIAIIIETSLGSIDAELDSLHAPITVANFLRYVDAKSFDGGSFFRAVTLANQPSDSVKIEVIQGGPPRSTNSYAPIPLERTSQTGLRHVDGTLSMARAGPNTATNHFFIAIGDQRELDFGGRRNPDGQGFAAFGRVTKGLDVVRAIQTQPVTAQALITPVRILRIVRR
jgi:peptidyl-prolyl cis-trans isomerase A (cyclophilin A)